MWGEAAHGDFPLLGYLGFLEREREQYIWTSECLILRKWHAQNQLYFLAVKLFSLFYMFSFLLVLLSMGIICVMTSGTITYAIMMLFGLSNFWTSFVILQYAYQVMSSFYSSNYCAGPTSFAPVIRASIDIVARSGQYHVLVIIADGQVRWFAL